MSITKTVLALLSIVVVIGVLLFSISLLIISNTEKEESTSRSQRNSTNKSSEEMIPEVPSSLPKWEEAKIEYTYRSGSDENTEHKTITLDANEEESFKTVQVFTSNETISEETAEVEDGDLKVNELLEILIQKQVVSTKENDEGEICDGGKSERIKVVLDNKTFFEGKKYYCPNRNYGTMDGKVEVFSELIQSI
jgi:hypothetical protein